MSGGVIQIFAKAPIPGQAKTRLIPRLGAEGAARLQRQLLRRTLTMARAQPHYPLQLWCAPDTKHPLFQACRRDYGVELRHQQGADLGARMAHALRTALAGHDWAMVIGTDCPHLTTDDLLQAADSLSRGSDAVLGPAADGGYYLIGLRHFEPSLFTAMPWGTDQVLALTRQRLCRHGIGVQELQVRHDLDRPEDLERFPELLTEPGEKY